ncbi:MAG: hypothetical protein K6G88_01980 [Lachnospiraceae bacterium]|jgi:hypothetical protein|nr:hypothetical protein [Lachnospiraceae bacterium]
MIHIEDLINKRISGIGRCSDMVWIAIGEEIDTHDWNNNMKHKSEFEIHIQSSFRFLKDKKIIAANDDIYHSIDDDNWDTPGNNYFDTWCNKKEVEGKIIKRITTNQIGDLKIELDDYVLEIINLHTNGEAWRILSSDCNEKHYVSALKSGRATYEYQ